MRTINSFLTRLSGAKKTLYPALLVLIIALCFQPLLSAEYLNYDDPLHYMTNRLAVDHSWQGFANLFVTPDSVNKTYIPLSILTYNLEHLLFGENPAVSHAINMALHGLGTLVLARLGLMLGLSLEAAYLGALIFAIHPIHVEPVAWVSSRKDVLYGLFFLASLLHYAAFVQSGVFRRYFWALLFATLSILAKPMALSLPITLFALDWLLGRPFDKKSLVQKLPFFLILVPFAWITFSLNIRPVGFEWPGSLILWFWCPAFYLIKFFWPAGLSPAYMVPLPVMPNVLFFVPWIMMAVALIIMSWRISSSRWPRFAVLFFVLNTFFLWRLDYNDISFVADRYMYIPSAGACLFLGWMAVRLFHRPKLMSPKIWGGLLCVIMIALGVTSYRQTSVWHNSWDNWTRVLDLYPGHYLASGGRAQCLLVTPTKGVTLAFVKHLYERKLAQPCGPTCGAIAEKLSYFKFLAIHKDALIAYQKNKKPVFVSFMGQAYWQVGDKKQAWERWQRAVREDPSLAEPYLGLALVAIDAKQNTKAIGLLFDYVKRGGAALEERSSLIRRLAELPPEERDRILDGAVLKHSAGISQIFDEETIDLLIPTISASIDRFNF